MRDHKLIMGGTVHLSSPLKSIIMRGTLVPRCEGLDTNGEQANRLPTLTEGKDKIFLFFHVSSLAPASPECDDSKGC